MTTPPDSFPPETAQALNALLSGALHLTQVAEAGMTREEQAELHQALDEGGALAVTIIMPSCAVRVGLVGAPGWPLSKRSLWEMNPSEDVLQRVVS